MPSKCFIFISKQILLSPVFLAVFVSWQSSAFASGLELGGNPLFHDAVYGGVATGPNDGISKSIVRILDKTNSNVRVTSCTGTMIADDVFITVGHCIVGGLIQPESRVQSFARPDEDCSMGVVEKVVLHPDYDHFHGVKIILPELGLVKLKKPLCGIVPATLKSVYNILPNDSLLAAGFGLGTKNPNMQADKIRLKFLPEEKSAVMDFYSSPDLADLSARISKMHDTLMRFFKFALTDSSQQSFCGGDSGGPVYLEFAGKVQLYGLNVGYYTHPLLGSPDCNDAFIQLVSPVAPYAKWILEETAKLTGSAR